MESRRSDTEETFGQTPPREESGQQPEQGPPEQVHEDTSSGERETEPEARERSKQGEGSGASGEGSQSTGGSGGAG